MSLFTALSGPDGHTAKMEDWTSVRAFPSGLNGVEKTNNESDLKYPQQVNDLNAKKNTHFCFQF